MHSYSSSCQDKKADLTSKAFPDKLAGVVGKKNTKQNQNQQTNNKTPSLLPLMTSFLLLQIIKEMEHSNKGVNGHLSQQGRKVSLPLMIHTAGFTNLALLLMTYEAAVNSSPCYLDRSISALFNKAGAVVTFCLWFVHFLSPQRSLRCDAFFTWKHSRAVAYHLFSLWFWGCPKVFGW